jgi:hypothetical protein
MGMVLLSKGLGNPWEKVAKRWSGRAVANPVEPVVGRNESAEPLPAAVFEIVNDRGQIWVTTDRIIWKAKWI